MPQIAKKILSDEIEAGFVRIEKILEETAKSLKDSIEESKVSLEKYKEENNKAIREAREDTRRLKESIDESKVSLEEYKKENNKAIMEAREDTRRLKESLKESVEDTRRLKAYVKKTCKALNVSVGGLNNTLGNMSESILVPGLVNKFNRMGFTFENMDRRRKIENDEHKIIAEVDAILENTTQAMAVEVKTTLKRDEVDHHAERMEKIRRDADAHNDKRQYFAAMAAAVVDDETKRYALNQGFYLIEPLGDDVTITKPGEARVW